MVRPDHESNVPSSVLVDALAFGETNTSVVNGAIIPSSMLVAPADSSTGHTLLICCAGLVAAVLLTLFFCQVSSLVLPCASSNTAACGRRGMQSLCIGGEFIMRVSFTAMIPLSYDLLDHYGGGPALSGIFVGIQFLSDCLGKFVGVSIFKRSVLAAKLCQVHSLSFLSVLFLIMGVALEFERVSGETAIYCLIGFRAICGFCFGITFTAVLFAQSATTGDEMTTLCVLRSSARNLGYFCGPLLSSIIIKTGQWNHWDTSVSAQTASLLYIMAPSLGLLALALYLFQPSDLGAVRNETMSFELKNARRKSYEQSSSSSSIGMLTVSERKHLMVVTVVYQTLRSATAGSIASSGVLLEVAYGWTPARVGLIIGLIYISSVPIALISQAVKGPRYTEDSGLVHVLGSAALLSTLLLFDWTGPRYTSDFRVAALTLGNCLYYATTNIVQGTMEGFGMQASIPDTTWSFANYLVINEAATSLVRLPGVAITNVVIVAYGQNVYAATLCGAAMAGYVLIQFVSQMMNVECRPQCVDGTGNAGVQRDEQSSNVSTTASEMNEQAT